MRSVPPATAWLSAVSMLLLATACEPAEPTGAASGEAGAPVESAAIDLRDIVRLPTGRIVLCVPEALDITHCLEAPYLDPDWSVDYVLARYPSLDPELVAEVLWTAAYGRALYERTQDPQFWHPEMLPGVFAELDASQALEAQVFIDKWRSWATEPGTRDLAEWRRRIFESMQQAIRDGRPSRIMGCADQERALGRFALCEATGLLSADRTVTEIIADFDGFEDQDAELVMEILRDDAELQHEARAQYGGGIWTPGSLVENLSERSRQLTRAKRRLEVAGETALLDARRLRGDADAGSKVLLCLERCAMLGGYSEEQVERFIRCDRGCRGIEEEAIDWMRPFEQQGDRNGTPRS